MTVRIAGLNSETHRHCLEAKLSRDSRIGGVSCSLLTRRIGDRVELLFHAVQDTGAELTPAQAREVTDALYAAAGSR